ncbi:MAG: type II toxin-antitoxin system RelE/ParE family toxin [Chitinophagaceae bacterium]
MGKRKITILEPAVEAVAEIAFYIEGQGLPETAKRFVDEVFAFFEGLSNDIVIHHLCKYLSWKQLGFRCANFKKKYVVAYLDLSEELIISEFVLQKLLT